MQHACFIQVPLRTFHSHHEYSTLLSSTGRAAASFDSQSPYYSLFEYQQLQVLTCDLCAALLYSLDLPGVRGGSYPTPWTTYATAARPLNIVFEVFGGGLQVLRQGRNDSLLPQEAAASDNVFDFMDTPQWQHRGDRFGQASRVRQCLQHCLPFMRQRGAQEYLFRLVGNKLFYYLIKTRDADSNEEYLAFDKRSFAGTIPLQHAEIVATSRCDTTFAIVLPETEESKRRVWVLEAASAADCREWLSNLEDGSYPEGIAHVEEIDASGRPILVLGSSKVSASVLTNISAFKFVVP